LYLTTDICLTGAGSGTPHYVKEEGKGALTIQTTGWNTNTLDYVFGAMSGVPHNDQGDSAIEEEFAHRLFGTSAASAEAYLFVTGHFDAENGIRRR
jgi:hypothetical protein